MVNKQIETGIKNQIHLVQTEFWNNFKKTYGTDVAMFEGVYFLLKNIPGTKKRMAYCPKVNFNVQEFNFEKFKIHAKEQNIAFIRFDVPNILLENSEEIQKNLNGFCVKAPRNTFTKKNIYMDLSPQLDAILSQMHQKKRYNIKQAEKRGVNIKVEQTQDAFENFWNLHKLTAKNQGFLIHSKHYFETVYKIFGKDVYFVQGFVDGKVASCWMIIKNDKTIYYIYGGSDPKFNNSFANDLVGFESIKLGKNLNAELFDMWGAEEGKGFTDFKLKYGGEMIEFIPSYDFVINKVPYYWFNFIYESFWKLVNFKKLITK